MASPSTLRITARAAFALLLVVVVALLLFPFYWMLNSALKSEPQLQMTPATFVPRSPATRLVLFSGESFRGIFLMTRCCEACSTARSWQGSPRSFPSPSALSPRLRSGSCTSSAEPLSSIWCS